MRLQPMLAARYALQAILVTLTILVVPVHLWPLALVILAAADVALWSAHRLTLRVLAGRR
jgi:hypothetical protein